MEALLDIVRQENIEQRFNRKLIDIKIREEIETSPAMQLKVDDGILLLSNWCEGTYYASKQIRVEQVKLMNLRELVMNIFIGVAYYQVPTLFTSVTAQLAGRLGFDDKRAAITTVAELLAVLCMTDAFDVDKAHKMASLTVVSRIPLSEELIEWVNQSQYLPPMVCQPLELKSNYDSGYLSHKDSLILGSGNHHSGDICLDVLNKVNRVALRLDFEFLCTCEEDPKEEFTIERVKENALAKGYELNDAEATERLADQVKNWEAFKARSQQVYLMLNANNNRFYLTHKVDKRGRVYSQGYHVNTQGSSFKKAAVELAKEELIEGVPT